jgi:hypothetical protein
MQKIMGGEFAIQPQLLKANIRKNVNILYSSGRCALYAILKSIEAGKIERNNILIPDYLCESVVNTVKDAKWNYGFYHITPELHVDYNSLEGIENYDAILLTNYFGMVDVSEDIRRLNEISPTLTVIEDDVQAYYEMDKSIADYSFTSLRKWFPCPDGALIRAANNIEAKNITLSDNIWSSYKVAGNLLKDYLEYLNENVVLELIGQGEHLLDTNYLSKCSDTSKIIFSSLDTDYIAKQRKSNAEILHDELNKIGVKHIYSDDCVPLFIPVFITNRDNLKKYFYKNNIFTPSHWSQNSSDICKINDLYGSELSLICDQRYSEKDMLEQIRVLKNFIYKNKGEH